MGCGTGIIDMGKHLDYLNRITNLIRECTIYCHDFRIDDWDVGFENIIRLFLEVKENGNTLFFIGNGGSAAIADHMTADFMKNGGMKTVGVINNALTTCMGNDYGYEEVFSRPIKFLLHKDDLLVAISSSGNSDNIVNAINAAKLNGGKVITFTGFRNDNNICQMGDLNLYVPVEHYGFVESIHNLFLQQIVDEIVERASK